MSVMHLARAELLKSTGYEAALARTDLVRLHANELPDSAGAVDLCNRYPPPRPIALAKRVAEVFEIDNSRLLITSGSNEGIDLLVRAFCRSGVDEIVVCTPTFGMYKISATIQHAGVTEVPLDLTFDLDTEAILQVVRARGAKLVFICSPGNPTGAALSAERIRALCDALSEDALIVLDQAYIEFEQLSSSLDNTPTRENLVVLRTFSKAYGLAGLRCGAVIAGAEIISLLANIQPPYAISTPTINGVLAALESAALATSQKHWTHIIRQRLHMSKALASLPSVRQVFHSDANFVFVRMHDAQAAYSALLDRELLVRSFLNSRKFGDCLRVTIGTDEHNKAVLTALSKLEVMADV